MSHVFLESLGWTLLHFIWEGALIGLLCAAILKAGAHTSANIRYLIGCGAMLAMVAAAMATFAACSSRTPTPGGDLTLSAVATHIDHPPQARPADVSPPPRLVHILPALDGIWFTGVLILSCWSLGGWLKAQNLKRGSRAKVPQEWEQAVARLANALRVSGPVRLLKSSIVEVPAVVGWLRPVILVPTSAFLLLSAEQLETLLAHELAHIRRYDYLVNLFQAAVEVIFFYHPAVWWIGSKIRAERENCCDDLAVQVCGNPVLYANALAGLEALRGNPRLVMAAKSGLLLLRVRRLLGHQEKPVRWQAAFFPLACVSLALVCLNSFVKAQAPAPSAPPPPPTAPYLAPVRAPQSPKAAPRGLPAAPTVAPPPAPDAPPPTPKAAPRGLPAAPTVAPPPTPDPPPPPPPGFLAGIAAAGYNNLTVDEIIELRHYGVTPAYMRGMKEAFGAPVAVPDLIRMNQYGVHPDNLREAKRILKQLNVDEIIKLQQAGLLERGVSI